MPFRWAAGAASPGGSGPAVHEGAGVAGGEAAAQALRAAETAEALEEHAAELGSLQRELGNRDEEQWRSTAGTAFREQVYALVLELAACREALERAASARRVVSAAEQLGEWGWSE